MNSVAGSILDVFFSFGTVLLLIANILTDKNKVTIICLQMYGKIVKYLYQISFGGIRYEKVSVRLRLRL